MSIWQHLFVDDLEYAPAKDILAGLTPQHVDIRPTEGMHTIFEELYHAAVWQRSMLSSARGSEPVAPIPDWPEGAADAEVWAALVDDFLTGSEEAVALGAETSRHDEVLPEGRTVRERLELLAVHNAYHLAKIVSLRQYLGIWKAPVHE